MTFHEYYGDLPTALLRLYRRANVSQSDHDMILLAFGKSYGDSDIPWPEVVEFVKGHVIDGRLQLPLYL